MHGSRKFCQRGPNSDNAFYDDDDDEVREEEMIQIAREADHHRPANETESRCRFTGVPIMAQN